LLDGKVKAAKLLKLSPKTFGLHVLTSPDGAADPPQRNVRFHVETNCRTSVSGVS